MKKNLFENYTLNKEKLLVYGFEIVEDRYVLYRKAIDDLFFEVVIDDKKKTYEINVKDEENEYYDLFNVENVNAYASKLQEMGESLTEDIVENCFFNLNIKLKIIDFIKKYYNIDPVFPFPNDNQSMVFKNKDGKWFVLYMKVKYKSLGVDKNESVEVINVKADEKDILNYIDNNIFFKAYHMNKKKWMTIVLNNKTPISDVLELIKKSYTYVTK